LIQTLYSRRTDEGSFEPLLDAKGEVLNSETLLIASTAANDSGMYFCVGATNSGMTPGARFTNV
jgi:hypothetical protein